MRHAEVLTDRILFLEGLPNYQRLFSLRIGETVPESSGATCGRGRGDRPAARGHRVHAASGDITSARIFEDILADEESHIDYLETQLGLIDKLGEPLYLQNVTKHPETS